MLTLQFCTLLTLCCCFYKFIAMRFYLIEKYANLFCVAIIIFMIGINLSLFSWFVYRKIQPQDSTFVSELGGYTRFGNGLYSIKGLIGNELIFSTYASALEVITGQFQPSGTDYIIHVLGDNQREEYIQTFLSGNFKFARTISPASEFVPWMKRANWFWYRELFYRYKPVKRVDYSVIWERVQEPRSISADNVEINIIKHDAQNTEIILDFGEKDYVADVVVKYNVNVINSFRRFNMLNKVVRVTDFSIINELDLVAAPHHRPKDQVIHYFLPANRKEWNIPIFIRDGKGSIMLTSQPTKHTTLEIIDINVIRLLPYDPIFFIRQGSYLGAK